MIVVAGRPPPNNMTTQPRHIQPWLDVRNHIWPWLDGRTILGHHGRGRRLGTHQNQERDRGGGSPSSRTSQTCRLTTQPPLSNHCHRCHCRVLLKHNTCMKSITISNITHSTCYNKKLCSTNWLKKKRKKERISTCTSILQKFVKVISIILINRCIACHQSNTTARSPSSKLHTHTNELQVRGKQKGLESAGQNQFFPKAMYQRNAGKITRSLNNNFSNPKGKQSIVQYYKAKIKEEKIILSSPTKPKLFSPVKKITLPKSTSIHNAHMFCHTVAPDYLITCAFKSPLYINNQQLKPN